jgi:hypothetical protein
MAELPASQTASTLIVPVGQLLADTADPDTRIYVDRFEVIGRLESSGNTVTLDAELFRTRVGAAGMNNVSQAVLPQVSVTANKALDNNDGLKRLDQPVRLAGGDTWWVKLTGTTAASTKIQITSVQLYTFVERSNF